MRPTTIRARLRGLVNGLAIAVACSAATFSSGANAANTAANTPVNKTVNTAADTGAEASADSAALGLEATIASGSDGGSAVAHCGAQSPLAVQVLGSGGPELTDGAASSGYLIWLEGESVLLVDVGPGTALRFEQAGGDYNALRGILFSHLHVDHSAALPAFVKGGFFNGRQADLPIFGPTGNALLPATSVFLQRLFGENGVYPYLADNLDPPSESGSYQLRATDVDVSGEGVTEFALASGIAVSAVSVPHGPLPALAWRVDLAGRSIVFSGDTSNRGNPLAALAQDADLLVMHNAVPETASGAAHRLHMRPSEIGRVAAAGEVGQLLISHRMERVLTAEVDVLREIRAVYKGKLSIAEDLGCYPVE